MLQMVRFLLIGKQACKPRLVAQIGDNYSRSKIFTAANLNEGLTYIQHSGPIDLALVDTDPSSLRTIEKLKSVCASNKAVRFAVLTKLDSRERIFASLAIGLHGFISKYQPDGDILIAINQILSGQVYIPWRIIKGGSGPHPAGSAHQEPACSAASALDPLNLTPRQGQVLQLLSLGMSNKEIARTLQIAESTTKIHTSMLMRALGVRNRTEAAFKAGKILNSAGLSATANFTEPPMPRRL